MNNLNAENNNRQVANWLLVGLIMLIIQVLLGGITRLTESGLSITEWKPFTGALPPMNDSAWQTEFEKYRHTDQFKYVHQSFTLSDFKFIFFWEWMHRQWARLMGLVFLAGFIYFLATRKITRKMIFPMIVLFVLGALQAKVGWVMVQSGLVPERYFVGHIELTTHLIAAMILIAYTLWFALTLLPSFREKVFSKPARKVLMMVLLLLILQLIYGGFMAGLKAGATAPTWPDINGSLIPAGINELASLKENLLYNKITIQFIHRMIAYLLLAFVIIFFVLTRNDTDNRVFRKLRISFFLLITIQVLLGIMTVMNATNTYRLVWFGVMHQLAAILLVICITCLLFITKSIKQSSVLS